MGNPLLSLSETEKMIFKFILNFDAITKDEIVNKLDIKLTTLNRFMKQLMVKQLVQVNGIADSSGGRKPILYSVDSKKYYFIGVDISRSTTNIVLINLKADILAQKRFDMDEDHTPKDVINQIITITQEMIELNKIPDENLLAIGVGTVGPLDMEQGIILNPTNFRAKGWNDVKIKEALQNVFNKPVLVDNGANTALLGEILKGSSRNYPNIAYFNLGLGIRSAFSSEFLMLRATNNLEDAFAHMTINFDGKRCHCGNKGCLECYCTIPNIEAAYSQERPYDFDQISTLVLKGDEKARDVIVKAAELFGIGLGNYINILNPQVVIISGPIINKCSLFYDIAIGVAKKTQVVKENQVVFCDKPFFGDHAIAVGAALMCLNQYIKI